MGIALRWRSAREVIHARRDVSAELIQAMTMDTVSANSDASVEAVRDYVRRLTPDARSRLLVELERLQLLGNGIKGTEALLAELRAEFRKGGRAHDRIKSPSRFFFQPLEPVLVDAAPEGAGSGRISRASLAPIWDWIGGTLLPVMTRDYENITRPLIVSNAIGEVEQMAAALQTKVFRILETSLATADGAERVRGELALYTASRTAIDDLARMLTVLRACHALARFQAGLPDRIASFAGAPLATTRHLLDALTATHADAMPFALTMVIKRLRRPWQLIRLATGAARSRDVADIAATPYAAAVATVLDRLDDQRRELSTALKGGRVVIARDILAGVLGAEEALRLRIRRIETSDWGRRLEQVMAAVASDLNAEADKLPDGVHHVFDARRLRRSGSGWRVMLSHGGVDAAAGLMTWCRGIVGAGQR